MDGIPLKQQEIYHENDVDPKECIICQKTTSQIPSCTINGRQRVIEAAHIREDEVTKRLKHVDDDIFVYHVSNDCYKKYTHKRSLDMISQARCTDNKQEADSHNSTVRSTRSSLPARDPASQVDVDLYKKTCVICGNAKHNNDYSKYRISEIERAEKFLQATLYF
jgi:hypothetical protein